jgi:hypothetical protein
MAKDRIVHRKKRESINRTFNAFAERRVLFSDSSNPALMISQPPVVATCAHPFAAMRITSWTVSASGRTLRLDARCEQCGVSYAKEMLAAADEEETNSFVENTPSCR